MAKITYPQQLPEDANSIKHVSIGQTRDGKDEWITPVTMWERNKSSGLYLPPGVLSDDDVAIPRVKAQLYGTKLEQVRTLLAGVATEDKLEQARALLQTISGKDFATQTTLAQVKSELELVKAELQAIKANQLSGDQKVQLSGTIMELYGATIDERPPANSVPVGATYMAVNTQDVWQSNGTDWVVM